MGAGRRLLLAVVCGVAVASIYVSQPMLDPMGRALDISGGASGWLVAAGQIGYLAGLILLVPLGDALDRQRLIAVQLALTGMGMLVTAAAGTAWVAFAGLATAGLFAVVVQTTVAYAAATSSAGGRGRNIGVVTSGVVVGILGGRVLAGALAQTWGWQSVYIVLGLLAVLISALVLVALPTDTRPATPLSYTRVLRPLGALAAERTFWSRGLIAFFMFASFGALWSGIAFPLHSSPWFLSAAEIGLFGLVGLAGALGASRAGTWADRGHARAVTGIVLSLLAGSWALIAQLPWSLWLLLIGVVVLDFAVQVAHVSNQHLLVEAFPERASTVIGGYMVFYSLGSALGATVTTAMYAAAGWKASSILGAAFAACALIVWAVSLRLTAGTSPLPRPLTEVKR